MTTHKKVVLVGNPNVGKSSLFNSLTGLRQKVGNFSGVTVSRKSGHLRIGDAQIELIDLPGTYTLYPKSEDERIACEVLHNTNHPDYPDLAVVVLDATQLKRGLLLATQLIDLQIPLVLAVNMVDLAEQSNVHIHYTRLSKLLDVPVVAVSALKDRGIKELKQAIQDTHKPSSKHILSIPNGFMRCVKEANSLIGGTVPYMGYRALMDASVFDKKYWEGLASLQAEANIEDPKALISNELLVRYDRVDGMLSYVVEESKGRLAGITHRLDRILLHKVWGYTIFLGILLLIFQSLFTWASVPMDMIDGGIGALGGWLEGVLPEGWIRSLVIDGVLAGLGGVVIFIPQIALLFLFISLLEESGYMSRVVFLMDRIMQPFGFSGRSVIPLIGGMACAIPSIMMTRTIPNPKERLITIMVTPLMSCSARLPVYVLLIAMFVPDDAVLGFFTLQGLVMTGLYVLGFVMALLAAFVFKTALQYKADGIFVAELPIYRMPRWKNVGITIYQKSKEFVVEAGKYIFIVAIVLWFLASNGPGDTFSTIDKKYVPQIEAAESEGKKELGDELKYKQASEKLESSYAGRLGKMIEPVIKPLGYDWKIGISLIASFAAREVFVGTMATIYSLEEPDVENDTEGRSLLIRRMKEEKNERGETVYSLAVILSLLVFYAFAMQCISTLAVTRKETGSWWWTFVMLAYLTGLAYVAAFVVFQLFR